MPGAPAACAWPLLLLLATRLSATAGAPQPWQCAPCSPEKLALCPPVPDSCTESARPANCGCCSLCTLPEGTACGVASARCASGLSCRALPGEQRPLQALIRGQGTCVPTGGDTGMTDAPADVMSSSESADMTQEELLENFHLMAPSDDDMHILWNAISNYMNSGTQVDTWKGPCHRDLHEVLGRLNEEQQSSGQLYRFYLPNCSKNGFYHSRQCETSLDDEPGLCWCVYPWSREKIPGSVEVRGDPNCSQYFMQS
uniref:Insulin-like growth factor-binding protein 1 n=1 Tax=Panthera leo TaxID=9689 RepID=A0A8C8X182_PANLE